TSVIVLMGQVTVNDSHPALRANSVCQVVAVVARDTVDQAHELLVSELEAAGFSGFKGIRAASDVPEMLPGRTPEYDSMFREATEGGIYITVFAGDEPS